MIIGFDNGRIILKKIFELEQPSSFADSTREFGMTSKKPLATWKPIPEPAEYAKIKPTTESQRDGSVVVKPDKCNDLSKK